MILPRLQRLVLLLGCVLWLAASAAARGPAPEAQSVAERAVSLAPADPNPCRTHDCCCAGLDRVRSSCSCFPSSVESGATRVPARDAGTTPAALLGASPRLDPDTDARRASWSSGSCSRGMRSSQAHAPAAGASIVAPTVSLAHPERETRPATALLAALAPSGRGVEPAFPPPRERERA